MRIILFLLLPVSWLQAEKINFSKQILPLLADKCFACHGPDHHEKTKLKLNSEKASRQKLKSGEKAIVPGQPGHSLLMQRITDSEDPMPPLKFEKTLSKNEIALLEQWIKEGAKYEQHWAYKKAKYHGKKSIDHWVASKLKKEKLAHSKEASPATLIRRLNFDLTGLPPDPKKTDDYLKTWSDKNYEKLIDELLASPHFGEKMAIAWLDGARYADSNGYNSNGYRISWPWRDWVIQSFNENKPYHTFVTELLAGDLLPGATKEQIIPTMFNRLHPISSENGSLPEEFRVEYAADRVETMGTVLMGLTLNCARCHDHKFDPIGQQDYYQLMSLFIDPQDEIPIYKELAGRAQAQPPFVTLDKSSYKDYTEILDHCSKKLDPKKEISKRMKGELKFHRDGLRVMVMKERSKPRQMYVLKGGAYHSPDKSKPVQSGGIRSLGPWPHKTERNRLGLAKWLLSADHPLTARVEVNRLWQQFFPKSLVRSPENFGILGVQPTHPELLDELALDFIKSGWDRKKLIKRILMSKTYRQLSIINHRTDEENKLLSRQFRRRLSAEEIRDNALSLSGLLDLRMGGDPVRPVQPIGIWEEMSNTPRYRLGEVTPMGVYLSGIEIDNVRRSIYSIWNRNAPPPFMSIFDAPTRNHSSMERVSTNTPQQALVTMNEPIHVKAAIKIASQVIKRKENDEQKISDLYFKLCGQYPSRARGGLLYQALCHFREGITLEEAQVMLSQKNSEKQSVELASWTMLCQTILNLDACLVRD